MKIYFVFFGLFSLCSCVGMRGLPDNISFEKSERGFSKALYCPDNTCDVLVFEEGMGKEEAEKVLWSFLFGFSNYVYLKDWRVTQEKRAVSFLRKSNCKYVNKLEALQKCVAKENIKHFEGKYRVEFIRYDEGGKWTVPLKYIEGEWRFP